MPDESPGPLPNDKLSSEERHGATRLWRFLITVVAILVGLCLLAFLAPDTMRENAVVKWLGGIVKWDILYKQFPSLLKAAKTTLIITSSSIVIGVALGLVIAMMRLGKRAWLRLPAIVYLEAFRGTPMLVQILLICYGIFPMLGLEKWPNLYPGIVALGLNSGAYLGEIFRGGIQSIDKGQREAALSLGMTEVQVMRHVVLPQALANALPAICNEFITLIKDSSLVSTIAVLELTQQANLIAARNYEYTTMYAGIAVMYFAMTFTTSRLLAILEKRLRAGSR